MQFMDILLFPVNKQCVYSLIVRCLTFIYSLVIYDILNFVVSYRLFVFRVKLFLNTAQFS